MKEGAIVPFTNDEGQPVVLPPHSVAGAEPATAVGESGIAEQVAASNHSHSQLLMFDTKKWRRFSLDLAKVSTTTRHTTPFDKN